MIWRSSVGPSTLVNWTTNLCLDERALRSALIAVPFSGLSQCFETISLIRSAEAGARASIDILLAVSMVDTGPDMH